MPGEQFDRLSLEQVFADMERAAIEGAGHAAGFAAGVAAARGRHRHRRGRAPGGGQLSVLPGGKTWKGAAVSGPAALKAAGLLTATAASIVIAVPALPSVPSLPGHHAQAFGGLSPTQALPALTPAPVRAYVPRHARPSADAATATPAPPPPVVVVAPVPSVPSAQPSAAPSGVLDVATVSVTIGVSGTARITFEAVGGPVSWSASSSSPALTLSDDGGMLGDRAPGSVTVGVRGGSLAGTGTVTITDGQGNATRVRVVWVALPGLGL